MTSITGFSNEETRAIEEFLRACCVPLVSERDGYLALWGTGTFFRQGPSLNLITAAHLFDDVKLEELGVPEFGTTGFITFGNCVGHFPTPDEKDLDVAVIRLDDDEFCARMSANWRVMDRRNVARASKKTNKFVVAGYPHQTVSMKGLTPEAFSQFYADRYHGPVKDANPDVDLFLTYGLTALGVDGQEKRTPELDAISGASIWAIEEPPSGFWSPEKVLKIVGVQSGYVHHAYMETKKWELVDQVLRRRGVRGVERREGDI